MNSDAPLVATPAVLTKRVDELVRYYRQVHVERMQDIPILNAALNVEAVSFEWAPSDQNTTAPVTPVAQGVLITPWFMSLVRVPAAVEPNGGRVGCSFLRAFGRERFAFIGAYDDELGYHESCALFSPMHEFASQEVARQTAQGVLDLIKPVAQDTPAAPRAEAIPGRRAFLLGRFHAGGAERV